MSDKSKKNTKVSRSLITVFIVIMILVCGVVSANAATDGALVEYVNKTVRVVFNGKETTPVITTNENGDEQINIDLDLEDGVNEFDIYEEENGTTTAVHFEVEIDEDGVEAGGNCDIRISANNYIEPTTAIE